MVPVKFNKANALVLSLSLFDIYYLELLWIHNVWQIDKFCSKLVLYIVCHKHTSLLATLRILNFPW
jgi:hypothetical protein